LLCDENSVEWVEVDRRQTFCAIRKAILDARKRFRTQQVTSK